jgi:hypothetical protein
MYAVQLQEMGKTAVVPGPIAKLGGGFGICIIVIAGWSTTNPILYSSGLEETCLAVKYLVTLLISFFLERPNSNNHNKSVQLL